MDLFYIHRSHGSIREVILNKQKKWITAFSFPSNLAIVICFTKALGESLEYERFLQILEILGKRPGKNLGQLAHRGSFFLMEANRFYSSHPSVTHDVSWP